MSRAGEKAWALIRAGILQGTYPPGERLKEEELAAQTGVSRTPVREALRRLIREGLVEHAPNVGTRVIRWTEQELEDVFELRALLEGHAVARAAQEMTKTQLEELRQLATEMERMATQQPVPDDLIAEHNRQFHRLILEVGGGPRLGDLLSTIVSIPVLLRTFRRYSPSELSRSMLHHREIIEALEAGDSVWARAVMQAHLRAALNVVRQGRSDAKTVSQTDETSRKQLEEPASDNPSQTLGAGTDLASKEAGASPPPDPRLKEPQLAVVAEAAEKKQAEIHALSGVPVDEELREASSETK